MAKFERPKSDASDAFKFAFTDDDGVIVPLTISMHLEGGTWIASPENVRRAYEHMVLGIREEKAK